MKRAGGVDDQEWRRVSHFEHRYQCRYRFFLDIRGQNGLKNVPS